MYGERVLSSSFPAIYPEISEADWQGIVQLAADPAILEARQLFSEGDPRVAATTSGYSFTDLFLDHLERIRQPGYSPTSADILCARRATEVAQSAFFEDDVSVPGKFLDVSITDVRRRCCSLLSHSLSLTTS